MRFTRNPSINPNTIAKIKAISPLFTSGFCCVAIYLISNDQSFRKSSVNWRRDPAGFTKTLSFYLMQLYWLTIYMLRAHLQVAHERIQDRCIQKNLSHILQ